MFSVLGSFFALVLLSSCNYYENKLATVSGPGTTLPTGKTTFLTIQRDIITPCCLRCHEGDDPAGGVALNTSYEQMVSDGLLTPGKSEESFFYTVIRDGSMPKHGPKPSAELVEKLRMWIEDGAAKE